VEVVAEPAVVVQEQQQLAALEPGSVQAARVVLLPAPVLAAVVIRWSGQRPETTRAARATQRNQRIAAPKIRMLPAALVW
jgi:hypothetical protein